MLAVKPHDVLPRQDYQSIAAAVRMELGEIVAALNTRFDAASLALGAAVNTIDKIVAALQEVASVFDTGKAATAVGNLMEAAENLRTVTGQAEARAAAVAEIRSSAVTLRSSAGDILRCIQVLDVYGMNVKINACGAAEFMDFADRMRGKLHEASGEVRGLDMTLERLERSLREMVGNDALLVKECAKVIPQVPDSLMRDAQALKVHQAGLVRLAQSTNTVAQAIRNELGLALSAIQIGDRVRQRLEHVMFGCQLAENLGTPGGEEIAHADAMRRHILLLLDALTRAATDEFAEETQALLVSLHRLKETAGQLTALQGGDRDEDGQGFLALLKRGIAEADGMIGQLSEADRQGAATLGQIQTTVDDVAAKMAAITELRLEVRNMAINIGLSCRNAGEIGKPIAVVANEIRSYSDRLDVIVTTIAKAESTLLESASQMNGDRGNGEKPVNQLPLYIEIIQECDSRTRKSLDFVDDNAGLAKLELERAISDLGILAENTRNPFESPSFDKENDCDGHGYPDLDLDIIQEKFEILSSTFTMIEEREAYNISISEIFPTLKLLPIDTGGSEFEDDIDDGLF